ncbi:MAG: hypothetical protein ACFE0P_16255 [Oceanicaulis sp.]
MDKPAFDFTSAAFFSFKAMGRRPGAFVWITLWQLILYAIVYGVGFWLIWPFYGEIFGALARGREPEEADILAHVARLVAGFGWLTVFGLLAALVAQGAWLRLLARDETAPGVPFRLGLDELRLFGVNLAFIFLNLVFWSVLFGVVFVPNIIALESGGDTGAVLGGAAVSALIAIAALIAWIILAIKFAAAPAMSVHQRRFRFFGSFAATGGITAWLLLVYLVLILIGIVGWVVVTMVQQVIGLLVAADLIGALAAVDPDAEPEVIFSILADVVARPGVLVALGLMIVVQTLFQVLFEAVWHGAGAYAALRHAGDRLAGPDAAPGAPADSVGDAPGEG